MKGKILLVDDDPDMRELLGSILSLNDCDVTEADSGAAVRSAFSREQPDIVLLDYKLPEGPGREPEEIGLELLPLIKRWADTEVIMLTGQGTMDMAIEAGRLGAYTFLSKPFETEKLLADVKCALFENEQNQENTALRRALETMSGNTSPVFRSAEMQEVVRTIERIAPKRCDHPHHRRKRHRQGSHRRPDPRHEPAQQGPHHQDQLRRAAPRTDRERTVRLRQRRLHRRAHRPRRTFPAGRGRHAVPRRNLRDAD